VEKEGIASQNPYNKKIRTDVIDIWILNIIYYRLKYFFFVKWVQCILRPLAIIIYLRATFGRSPDVMSRRVWFVPK
jgi:hypothetical protein